MTLVPVEFCQELARGMRAEKITRRLYRLFPPDSIFPSGFSSASQPASHDLKPSPANMYGTIFREPTGETWIQEHHAAIQSVRVRAWMTYKALFRVSAKGAGSPPPAPALLAESNQ